MVFLQDNIWWVGGFLILANFCIVAMLWRNNAAKNDNVLRSENDTVINSVSFRSRNNTAKWN